MQVTLILYSDALCLTTVNALLLSECTACWMASANKMNKSYTNSIQRRPVFPGVLLPFGQIELVDMESRDHDPAMHVRSSHHSVWREVLESWDILA